MKWEFWFFPGLVIAAGVAVACAGLKAAEANVPPPPAGSFLMQIHRTGTVSPRYYKIDTLLVDTDGAWTATRKFPYSQPPAVTTLATGSLTTAQMRQLQQLAIEPPATGEPSFSALPPSIGAVIPGAGTRAIALELPGGQMHEVEVVGAAPEAFNLLDSAIASATVDLNSVGPLKAH